MESPQRRDEEQREGGDEPVEASPDDELVRRETERAAAAAGRIGGVGGAEGADEAERPVAEGGGGEAEGFEQAEQALVEQAEHGEGRPADRDAPKAEPEADRATHGEADHARAGGEGDEPE
jgi:hypothetical protein